MTGASPIIRTRLAPSPTGELHLGNARTFLLAWALARNEGGEVVLRIEDLDAPRVRPEAVPETIETLAWLGLDWDGPAVRQSDDLEPYRAAMRRLAAVGAIFRCDRSRRDVRLAASAPHAEDGEVRFEPSLRPGPEAYGFSDEFANHRLRVDPGPVAVEDLLYGRRAFDPGLEAGDFLVWTKAGVPSYQLAVTVDDRRQGIRDVIRGDDLLPSAARQEILHRLLGGEPPRWWHLPLVADAEGRRLAKRHGGHALRAWRERGARRERILGFLAHASGLTPERTPLDPAGFRALVTRDTLQSLVARESAPGGGLRLPDPLDPEFLAWISSPSPTPSSPSR